MTFHTVGLSEAFWNTIWSLTVWIIISSFYLLTRYLFHKFCCMKPIRTNERALHILEHDIRPDLQVLRRRMLSIQHDRLVPVVDVLPHTQPPDTTVVIAPSLSGSSVVAAHMPITAISSITTAASPSPPPPPPPPYDSLQRASPPVSQHSAMPTNSSRVSAILSDADNDDDDGDELADNPPLQALARRYNVGSTPASNVRLAHGGIFGNWHTSGAALSRARAPHRGMMSTIATRASQLDNPSFAARVGSIFNGRTSNERRTLSSRRSSWF